jgi:hypothetical protein
MSKKKPESFTIKYKDKELIANTPVNNWDKYQNSVLAIQSAAKVSDITNIGVIARYGAGKSSLIKTFLSNLHLVSWPFAFGGKRPISKNRTRVVSISAFEHQKDQKNDRIFVETEIMKQLFMSVGKQRVPDSRIPRVGGFKWRFVALPFLFFIAFGLALFSWSVVSKNYPLGWFSFVDDGNRGNWTAISAILSGLFTLAFIIDVFICLPFQKMSVSLKDATITAEKKESFNLLDEYLDEILYFFEKTKINLVIFEDIDRFENMDVLSDIRSLCFELNKDSKIRRRGGVAFIYCISDAMKLQAEDKSKFFDIAIPVVPIMNAYNSAETFLASPLFNDNSPIHPSQSVIMLLSKFVTEKRVSNAVINDYQFYCAAHEVEGSKTPYLRSQADADSLFALMVYRQLFPADFEKIENGTTNSVLSNGFSGASNVPDSTILEALKKDQRTLEVGRFIDLIRSFYATIANHHLIQKDFLRLISEFQPGVFKDASDKAFYEKVIANEVPTAFDEPIYDPRDVYNKLSTQELGYHSAHNIYFALEVAKHLSKDENPSKAVYFFQSFTQETPDNDEFIRFLFKTASSEGDIERFSDLLALINALSSWLIVFVFDKKFSETNFPLFHAFLYRIAFLDGETATAAFSRSGNDRIFQYFANVTAPSKELEDFSPAALQILIKQGYLIKSLSEAKRTPQMEKIVEANGFSMTLKNYERILQDFYGIALNGHSLFTFIFEKGAPSFAQSALLNAPQMIKDWLSEGHDFAGEKNEAVQRIITEVHSSTPLEWLLPFLRSAATKISLQPSFPIPTTFLPAVLDSGILVPDFVWFSKTANAGTVPFSYFANSIYRKVDSVQNSDMTNPDCIRFVANLEAQVTVKDQNALGALLKKLDVPQRTALPGNPCAAYADCLAGKLAYSQSILQGISAPLYHDAFSIFAQQYLERILLENDLSYMPEQASSFLLGLCTKPVQRRIVLQKCQNSLFVEKNRKLIEENISGIFSATSWDRLAFLYNGNIPPEIVERIAVKSAAYIRYDLLFLYLANAHKTFGRMAKDPHQIFATPTNGDLAKICENLVTSGYLAKTTDPSGKSGYLVSPSHVIK